LIMLAIFSSVTYVHVWLLTNQIHCFDPMCAHGTFITMG
jgi:hypothetical protein